ncbi:tyrosine recombinase XerC [Ideonella sp. TBM-1]|uniref:Tyrosine recombinase XerC n=1 Tax=Ideonella livida TaxID=2707176 RepID=A0A7C9TKG7_9BURK|nr:tyrosine recombinase XerC [Ideonella livida]
MPDPLPAYLTHLRVERRLAARSLALYAQALARLAQGVAQHGLSLDRLGPATARRLMAQAHAQGLGPRSLALMLASWRGLYRWWCRGGAPGAPRANPIEGLRPPRAPQPLPKALGVDDAVRLAEAPGAHPHPAAQARDRALVELLYGAGLRVAELVGLDLHAHPGAAGWLDLEEACVQVLGKGSRRRSAPLGAAALQALREWLDHRASLAAPQETALFVGQRGRRLSADQVRQRVRAQGRQAGLDVPVHPHMLRHSYASHLLQSSGDLRGVQELLGHASIRSTQVYTRLDFQHLAQVYDQAHPRAHRRTPAGPAPADPQGPAAASSPAGPLTGPDTPKA